MGNTGSVKRKEFILELIKKNDVSDQENLMSLLKANGIDSSQSTISKDLKALGIIKGLSGNYILGDHAERQRQENLLIQMLQNEVNRMPKKPKYLYIATKNESASMIGNLMENLYDEVVGTIAVGNSLLIVLDEETMNFKKKIRSIMNMKMKTIKNDGTVNESND
ncbi:hypothetical protein [Paenibacillus pabuli]|uniref:hypothetical protein n=1 Tax=Paenibacillus pabuli TaxID=1472 RepID=UPI003CE8216D